MPLVDDRRGIASAEDLVFPEFGGSSNPEGLGAFINSSRNRKLSACISYLQS
jgi:hypothetical protein